MLFGFVFCIPNRRIYSDLVNVLTLKWTSNRYISEPLIGIFTFLLNTKFEGGMSYFNGKPILESMTLVLHPHSGKMVVKALCIMSSAGYRIPLNMGWEEVEHFFCEFLTFSLCVIY